MKQSTANRLEKLEQRQDAQDRPPFSWATIDALLRGEPPEGYSVSQIETMQQEFFECFNLEAIERMIQRTA